MTLLTVAVLALALVTMAPLSMALLTVAVPALAVVTMAPLSMALLTYLRRAGFVIWHHGFASFTGESADTQFIVAGKGPPGARQPHPAAVSRLRLGRLHVPPFLKELRREARKRCKRPCPGLDGDSPDEYLRPCRIQVGGGSEQCYG